MKKIQNDIYKNYKHLKLTTDEVKNECTTRLQKIEYTKSQKFIKDFFSPKNPLNGILINHSVGAGKTATAVYTAHGFENDYQIIWVTNRTLKQDMWKNVIGDMSAHPLFRDYKGQIPVTPAGQKRLFNKLTGRVWLQPLSYEQLSNALHIKYKFGKETIPVLTKLGEQLRNRNRDPLWKTLLIVDEAHNITKNIKDYNIIKDAIKDSYAMSGKDSVRLLLLTATPVNNDISEFTELIDLLTPKKMYRSNNELIGYVNRTTGELNNKGKKYFNEIGKYISYLNVKNDKNKFAQVSKLSIDIIISQPRLAARNIELDKEEIENLKGECSIMRYNSLLKSYSKLNLPIDIIIELMQNSLLKMTIKDIKILVNHDSRIKECKTKTKDEKKQCTDNVKKNFSVAKKNLKTISNTCKNNAKQIKKDLKFSIKENKSIIKIHKNFLNSKKIDSKEKILMLPKQMIKMRLYEHPDFFNNMEHNRNYYNTSPKLKTLLETIRNLDRRDYIKYNNNFKHAIFINKNGYNMKILLSCLIANGFESIIKHRIVNGKTRLYITNNIPNTNKNLAILSSSALFRSKQTKTLINNVLSLFNARPGNIYGNNARFIIIDSGFLEGVDLFDVKYLHVLDDALFKPEMEQLIGRVTRYCGQKGLQFTPNKGWEVKVIEYTTKFDEYKTKEHILKERIELLGLNNDITKIQSAFTKGIKDYAFDKKINQ